jgi:hypothetical protein
MNCPSCKAQIPDGAKFCPSCKTAITSDDTMAKATCPACGAEGLASYQFCPVCSGAMVKALDPAEYDRALGALETLAKANAELDEDLDIVELGEDENDDEDSCDPTTLGKSELPDGLEAVDAAPLIKSLLVANNRIVKQLRSVGHEARATRRDNAVLAKAVTTLMTANKMLRDEIASWGAKPRGPRSVRAEVFGKAVTPPLDTNTGDGQTDIHGLELISKATTAALTDGTRLSAHEVAQIEGYANMGYGLGEIRGLDPELAGRFDAAVTATKQ